jgi:hypothetical protein
MSVRCSTKDGDEIKGKTNEDVEWEDLGVSSTYSLLEGRQVVLFAGW